MHAYPPPGRLRPRKDQQAQKLTVAAYNAEQPAPPVYQPPMGSSKVNPTQDWTRHPGAGLEPGPAVAGEASSATHAVSIGQRSSAAASKAMLARQVLGLHDGVQWPQGQL
ncbi:MAG: hypothetical protein Q9163_001715 [Psora crenata]